MTHTTDFCAMPPLSHSFLTWCLSCRLPPGAGPCRQLPADEGTSRSEDLAWGWGHKMRGPDSKQRVTRAGLAGHRPRCYTRCGLALRPSHPLGNLMHEKAWGAFCFGRQESCGLAPAKFTLSHHNCSRKLVLGRKTSCFFLPLCSLKQHLRALQQKQYSETHRLPI